MDINQVVHGTSDSVFKRASLVELWCAEPVFFASRELSDTFYTEGVIGNYALAYAFGLAASPYSLCGRETYRPSYMEDLRPLNNRCYVLPAWPAENAQVSFRFERFNGLSDSLWFAMAQGRVVTAREELEVNRGGSKTQAFRSSNFPQTGRLRMIDRGNRFHTLVFGEVDLPEYVRVGKFMSKVRVRTLSEHDVQDLPTGEYRCTTYLNSADLAVATAKLGFDLIAIPPVSLLKNLIFSGPGLRAGEHLVPAGMAFCG